VQEQMPEFRLSTAEALRMLVISALKAEDIDEFPVKSVKI
jgi:hypothetical protein